MRQVTYQIIFLKDKKISESSWNDISCSTIHSTDTKESDLAEDGSLSKCDYNFASVDASQNLDLS